MLASSLLSRAPTMSSRAETYRPPLCERIHALACRLLTTRNVNQDIAVDQVGHVSVLGERSDPKVTLKIGNVFDAVADVGPVLPHAVERKIPKRAGFALEAVAYGGTRTSTMVPSLILTSSRGLKTPSSYFAVMVMDSPGWNTRDRS